MLKNYAFHFFYPFGLPYPPVVDQELYGGSWALFWSSLRAIPTRQLGKERRYNRSATADYSADLPVGMTYLLGDRAPDRREMAVAGRLCTADLYQACWIFHCRLIAKRLALPGDESA